jgi:hypothetical protein
MWFWLIGLAMVSALVLLYRVLSVINPVCQRLLLAKTIHGKGDPKLRRAMVFVHRHCQPGDWFVLCQLRKNMNPFFYHQFIRELAVDLWDSPKEPAMEMENGNI